MRAAACAGAVLALTACGNGTGVCPAVAEGRPLTVELAPGWPPVGAGSVQVGCPGRAACRDGTGRRPDGAVLAELEADLEWVRVGGSEECGGPMAATVTVPAP